MQDNSKYNNATRAWLYTELGMHCERKEAIMWPDRPMPKNVIYILIPDDSGLLRMIPGDSGRFRTIPDDSEPRNSEAKFPNML